MEYVTALLNLIFPMLIHAQKIENEINAAPFPVSEAQGGRASTVPGMLPVYHEDTALGGPNLTEHRNDAPEHFVPTPSAWPPELVDSMVWSSQFLGAVQPKE